VKEERGERERERESEKKQRERPIVDRGGEE